MLTILFYVLLAVAMLVTAWVSNVVCVKFDRKVSFVEAHRMLVKAVRS